MASLPSISLACSIDVSSSPRCTPSAATAFASSISSLMIKLAWYLLHKLRNVEACSSRFAALPDLSRYWMIEVPSLSACSMVAAKADSGIRLSSVIAYKPRSFAGVTCFYFAQKKRSGWYWPMPMRFPCTRVLCV